MMTFRKRTFGSIKRLAGALLAFVALSSVCIGATSCSEVYDDLEECPQGVVLRFVFDHNLEFANAFPSQVDCLSLFIF